MKFYLPILEKITSANASTFAEKIEAMFHFDGWDSIDPPLLTSLIVMLIIAILGTIIGIRARIGLKRKEYLKRPKGLLLLGEIYYDTCKGFAGSNMGSDKSGWGGYFFTLLAYLFLAFIIPLTGLPSLVDWLACPLSLAVIMFTIIQIQAIKHSKMGYFKRFTEPIFVFLPINLITFWSPMISTTMRMFGNCLSGTVLIGIIQWALGNASSNLLQGLGVLGTIGSATSPWYTFWNEPTKWTSIFLAPIPIGILQAYFSLFSGFIQTLVFSLLSAIWIAQEMPEEKPSLQEEVTLGNLEKAKE